MRTDDRTEEQVLVMRAQRGEQAAFRVLVERYSGMAYALALRMTGAPPDAEDVVQEAFLAAWKALPRFRMDAKFSTWLYRLTANAAADLLRRRKKNDQNDSLDDLDAPVHLPDPAPSPQERAEQSEREAALRRGLAKLSENHRRILLLRELGGLSYDEIAEELKLTPGTVKSRLARARLELRQKLLDDGNFFFSGTSNQEKGGNDHG